MLYLPGEHALGSSVPHARVKWEDEQRDESRPAGNPRNGADNTYPKYGGSQGDLGSEAKHKGIADNAIVAVKRGILHVNVPIDRMRHRWNGMVLELGLKSTRLAAQPEAECLSTRNCFMEIAAGGVWWIPDVKGLSCRVG